MKKLRIAASKKHYVLGFSFGCGDKQTVQAYVITTKSKNYGEQKAIDMVVDHPSVPFNCQVSTRTFKDEDEMADFWDIWFDKLPYKNIIYDGCSSSTFL